MNITLVAIEKEGLVKLASSGTITSASFDASGKNPLERLLGQNWNTFKVLLDMSGTTFIDSSAIGWLLASNKKFKDSGGALVIHNVQPNVRRVLDLLKIGRSIHITDDVETAREMVIGAQA